MKVDVELCGHDDCRLIKGHKGKHALYPTKAWDFLEDKDRNKLTKAGFATPRGGDKGGYQNHVNRNNTVIVPYERLGQVDLKKFADGYVIRLLPGQCFEGRRVLKPEFIADLEVPVPTDRALYDRLVRTVRDAEAARESAIRGLRGAVGELESLLGVRPGRRRPRAADRGGDDPDGHPCGWGL